MSLPIGCADRPDDSLSLVEDSAGVTLVDHGRVAWRELPLATLAGTPSITVGRLAGGEAQQLHRVEDTRLRRDGSVVILDRGTRIQAFDASGAHLWTAGREGSGPGEFRFASLVREIRGDSLLVWDGALKRLSIFARDGSFVRAANVRLGAPSAAASGMTDPEHILVQAVHGERTRVDGHEALVHPSDFYIVDMRGEVRRELGRLTIAVNFREVDEGGAYSPAIFAAGAVAGPAPEGLWFADLDQNELRLVEGVDRTTRIVRWRAPGRAVTDGDVQAVVETWMRDADPEVRAYLAAYGRTHPRAERFPAYDDLLVDRAGRLWLRDFVREHEDDGSRTWTALSPDGTRTVARLRHHAGFEPHDIGERWVLGVEKDDLGVETVRMYGLLTGR